MSSNNIKTKGEKMINARLKSLGIENKEINKIIRNLVNSDNKKKLSNTDKKRIIDALVNKYSKNTFNGEKFSNEKIKKHSNRILNLILKNVDNARKQKKIAKYKLNPKAEAFVPSAKTKEQENNEEVLKQLYDIFNDVCKLRKEETRLINKAKRKMKNDKRNNRELVEYEAYQEVRNFKDNRETIKTKQNLSEKLKKLEENVKNNNKIDISTMFEIFVKTEPSCQKIMRWKTNTRNIGYYDDLKDYLGFANKRNEVMRKRNVITSKSIRTSNGKAIKKLRPLETLGGSKK